MRLCCLAVLICCASCLDFGKFEPGTSGGGDQGGENVGAGGSGGGGGQGGEFFCPSDPPAEPCVVAATGFDGGELPDWTLFPAGSGFGLANCVGNQSDCAVNLRANAGKRLDFRTDTLTALTTCSATIAIEAQSDGAWTLLELVPDQSDSEDPDQGQRIEVGVRPGFVRFKLPGQGYQQMELESGLTATALRIQVRADGVALEALRDEFVIGCFVADKPASLSQPVRVGMGVDANAEESGGPFLSTFDSYGTAP